MSCGFEKWIWCSLWLSINFTKITENFYFGVFHMEKHIWWITQKFSQKIVWKWMTEWCVREIKNKLALYVLYQLFQVLLGHMESQQDYRFFKDLWCSHENLHSEFQTCRLMPDNAVVGLIHMSSYFTCKLADKLLF